MAKAVARQREKKGKPTRDVELGFSSVETMHPKSCDSRYSKVNGVSMGEGKAKGGFLMRSKPLPLPRHLRPGTTVLVRPKQDVVGLDSTMTISAAVPMHLSILGR